MSMWDDEAGYSRDDPKHPGWAESRAERADHDRKAAKDRAPASHARPCPHCDSAGYADDPYCLYCGKAADE